MDEKTESHKLAEHLRHHIAMLNRSVTLLLAAVLLMSLAFHVYVLGSNRTLRNDVKRTRDALADRDRQIQLLTNVRDMATDCINDCVVTFQNDEKMMARIHRYFPDAQPPSATSSVGEETRPPLNPLPGMEDTTPAPAATSEQPQTMNTDALPGAAK